MVNTHGNSGVHSKLRACYKKRKDCIKKKTSEPVALCGVNACIVCIGPDRDVDSWPENPNQVKSVIDLYNDYLKNEKNEIKEQRVYFDEYQKKETLSDLSTVLDEKLRKVEERIEFLSFMKRVLENYHTDPYSMEETESHQNTCTLSFDMDGDTYEQNMIWNELENQEGKSTSVRFSGECIRSTIVNEGSSGGSAPSACYTGHPNPIEIGTYWGCNNVFEWDEKNFDELLEPIW